MTVAKEILTLPVRRGGRTGYNDRPLRADMVMKIVCLYERNGWNFRDISDALGTSPANISKQYMRWHRWARKQPSYGVLKGFVVL